MNEQQRYELGVSRCGKFDGIFRLENSSVLGSRSLEEARQIGGEWAEVEGRELVEFLHLTHEEYLSRKHSTPEDRLSMIHDPSHGWLIVPIADVEASGIEVSEFSYKTSKSYALEEDKDATAYLESCGYVFSREGKPTKDRIDIDHRHYKSIDFQNGAVRCTKEN